MWVKIAKAWYLVAWTDPDYISVTGEMLHKTRCGLLKIRPQVRNYPDTDRTCSKCLSMMRKDALT